MCFWWQARWPAVPTRNQSGANVHARRMRVGRSKRRRHDLERLVHHHDSESQVGSATTTRVRRTGGASTTTGAAGVGGTSSGGARETWARVEPRARAERQDVRPTMRGRHGAGEASVRGRQVLRREQIDATGAHPPGHDLYLSASADQRCRFFRCRRGCGRRTPQAPRCIGHVGRAHHDGRRRRSATSCRHEVLDRHLHATDGNWAGVDWQYPFNNWGSGDGLVIPAGATQVSFVAWGDVGRKVSFNVGYGPTSRQ